MSLFQRSPAINAYSGPSSSAVIFDTRQPAAADAIAYLLVMMGPLGRELDQAKAGVRSVLRIYRRKQAIAASAWNARYPEGSPLKANPAAWRPHVRSAIAAVRDVQDQINAEISR